MNIQNINQAVLQKKNLKNLEIIYEIKKPFANLIKYVYFIYKIILDIYQLPKQPCLLNKGMYYFIYDQVAKHNPPNTRVRGSSNSKQWRFKANSSESFLHIAECKLLKKN